ncbi:prepilin-type N-terminal cleavage/methylation domain-containing protein [Hephaestia caeni]|uniref:Prepilin-type N-terminal cleavage/methylation domain-containing protein n=1 Tax=Hephaestia caeni TaxID=645617 RepID=A0A397PEH3_9SPHN|nr:type II secretion system protein [Hephaestia caeni]RIA46319.1 prepilin-type N-terminal cleavage/methylation domain-containing protein [Hephaestia caeni]
MSVRPSEAGFSLIETLVSLAVIAGMSSLLFESIATHAQAADRVARKREAILLARSLLAQATVPEGPGELADTGRWRDMSWRFTRGAVSGGARDTTVPLQRVRIDVMDGVTGRRLVSVQSLRLRE